MTKSQLLKKATNEYLSTIDTDNPPSPADIQEQLLNQITVEIALENQMRGKDNQLSTPKALLPVQIAAILLHLYPIVKIAFAGLDEDGEYDMLAVYQSDGTDKGLYVTDEGALHRLIREYDYEIKGTGIKEVLDVLSVYAPRRSCCANPDLIAVNNGIFDYRTKTLLPFSPELVFTAKARVDYNPNAQKVVIHNDGDGTDWDVDSWLSEVANNDPEVVQLLWEIIGATIRPNVPWNKSAWFISETGNNGKGTLCSLMREVLGKGSHTSIPLTAFEKDFMLEPLIKVNAVITDENPVGIYIDKVANLKAIITGDMVLANRKYKTPVAIRFRGLIIQCVNEMPKVKDRSASFLRRLLPVPFMQCFTGRERKYIKEEYLKRSDVLEYVLNKVLNMDYYELSEPAVCKQMLAEFRVGNDPVAQFVEEILPQCKWDFLPYAFLYALFRSWLRENCPSSPLLNKNSFIKELRRILETSTTWNVPQGTRQVGGRMNASEPLIWKYSLKEWSNPLYRGTDIDKLCHPPIPAGGVRGIERR